MLSFDAAMLRKAITMLKKLCDTEPETVDIETSIKKGLLRLSGEVNGKIASVALPAKVDKAIRFNTSLMFLNALTLKGGTGLAIKDNVAAFKDSAGASGTFSISEHKGVYQPLVKENKLSSKAVAAAIAAFETIMLTSFPNLNPVDVYMYADGNVLELFMGDNFHIASTRVKTKDNLKLGVSCNIFDYKKIASMKAPTLYYANESLYCCGEDSGLFSTLILPSIIENTTLRDVVKERRDEKVAILTIKDEEFVDKLASLSKLPNANIEWTLDDECAMRLMSSDFEQRMPLHADWKGKGTKVTLSTFQTKDFASIAKKNSGGFTITLQVMRDCVRAKINTIDYLMTRVS